MASVSTEVLPEDETIRTATVEDYQAVLDIDLSLYQGRDYLPSTFTSLVEGEGVKGYVYLKQDRVVGFLSSTVVDGGHTLLTTAGRIMPDYRGQRMYGRLNRRVLREALTSPSVSHVVFSTSKLNMDAFGRHFSREYSVVMEKMVTTMDTDVDQIRMELSNGPVHSMDHLQPLTHHHLHSMLSQPPSHLHHLFPQQRILLNWEPYRIMADNADVIVNSCRDRVFVAAATDLALIGKGNNFPVTLLTCGTYYHCARGTVYQIDLFGAGSDSQICSHLEWHLRRLVEVAKENSALFEVFAEGKIDGAVAILEAHFPVRSVAPSSHSVFVLEGVVNRSTGEICPSVEDNIFRKSAD